MNWMAIYTSSAEQLATKFPNLKRFFQQGFLLEPKHHSNDVVGLKSPLQVLRVNVITGEIENV